MAREKELLQEFQRLVDAGELLQHFLDQSHAIKMVDDVQQRLVARKSFDSKAFKNPVSISGMLSNTSWSVNFTISEVAREISYRLNDHDAFQQTGFNNFVDQRTGSPSPRTNFQLPLRTERKTIWVKYVDIRGTERGPFELRFDPKLERIRSGKQILTQLPHAWVSFRLHGGSLLAYFSHLQGYRYAISDVRYSIGSDALDQVLPLAPVEPDDPHALPADTVAFITVAGETRFVAVQLTFGDGTKSKLRRFEYRGAAPPAIAERPAATQVENQNYLPQGQGRNAGGNSPLERVDVNIDPTFRRAPRVRFGFGF